MNTRQKSFRLKVTPYLPEFKGHFHLSVLQAFLKVFYAFVLPNTQALASVFSAKESRLQRTLSSFFLFSFAENKFIPKNVFLEDKQGLPKPETGSDQSSEDGPKAILPYSSMFIFSPSNP